MVTNPQERPRISWVLDQVQNLRGSDGTDVDTNRVWCYHWDFMPVFQWTPDFLDYALSLPDKNHKPCKHLLSLTSVSSACLSYTRKFVGESHIFTPKSVLSNEIIWWFWGKIWAGHVPDLCHANHTRGQKLCSPQWHLLRIIKLIDCFLIVIWLLCLFPHFLACTFLGTKKIFMTVSI